MGICETKNNSPSISDNNKRNSQSFRCFYDIKDIYQEIDIINKHIDEELKSKIKILNDNKEEEIVFTKIFKKIGINTIDFIIEGKLTNIRDIFSGCIKLIKIEFISIDISKVKDMNSMFYCC